MFPPASRRTARPLSIRAATPCPEPYGRFLSRVRRRLLNWSSRAPLARMMERSLRTVAGFPSAPSSPGNKRSMCGRFPAVDTGRWQVSTTGGRGVRWSRDGRELFYTTFRRQGGDVRTALMAVSIEPESNFTPGTPAVLFEASFSALSTGAAAYDVSLDGQRFLLVKTIDDNNEGKPLADRRRAELVRGSQASRADRVGHGVGSLFYRFYIMQFPRKQNRDMTLIKSAK